MARTPPPPFFCKCVKRKGFKSFVLKLCETKGVADAFLRKCVKLKSLGDIFVSSDISRSLSGLSGGLKAGYLAAPGDNDSGNYTKVDYRLSRADLIQERHDF